MNVWEKVIKQTLRKIRNVSDNQFGFMSEDSTMKAIFLLRQLQKKYIKKRKNLHVVVIDLKKLILGTK